MQQGWRAPCCLVPCFCGWRPLVLSLVGLFLRLCSEKSVLFGCGTSHVAAGHPSSSMAVRGIVLLLQLVPVSYLSSLKGLCAGLCVFPTHPQPHPPMCIIITGLTQCVATVTLEGLTGGLVGVESKHLVGMGGRGPALTLHPSSSSSKPNQQLHTPRLHQADPYSSPTQSKRSQHTPRCVRFAKIAARTRGQHGGSTRPT